MGVIMNLTTRLLTQKKKISEVRIREIKTHNFFVLFNDSVITRKISRWKSEHSMEE